MGLLNTAKKEKLYEDYPTEEEYFGEISRIQREELNSDRYTLAYEFLMNNYWHRNHEDLENELFKIIGTYGIEDTSFNKSREYLNAARAKRYGNLKRFIGSLTEEQINSNIFLKRTRSFMNMSEEICTDIMAELYKKINIKNELGTSKIELKIPKKIQELIPSFISEQRGIKYCKPEDFKISYIYVLDPRHKYVYEDYNLVSGKIGKLAEDVFYLQLSEMLFNVPSIECFHFQVYHPGYDNCFIAEFFVKEKEDNQILQEDDMNPSEEFIQTTVTNFKRLLDMGLIDISVLEGKNTGHVLEKKTNEI